VSAFFLNKEMNMTFFLNERSLKNLEGVHPDLRKVAYKAADICPKEMQFVVTEGLRSIEKQRENMANGASKTMNSRHLTGHAFDVAVFVNGEYKQDWPLYTKLSKTIKEAAKLEGVKIEWGGDWKTIKDGPHYQLPWKLYKK
jgi:peptidoglycan LD-endopeptidase CwlK